MICIDIGCARYGGDYSIERLIEEFHPREVRPSSPSVRCIDLARVIVELPDEPIVLKVDAEGAEYELLAHLIAHGADARLQLAWVEWHRQLDDPDNKRRAAIETRLACDVAEWRW